jgi:hypothetical protein
VTFFLSTVAIRRPETCASRMTSCESAHPLGFIADFDDDDSLGFIVDFVDVDEWIEIVLLGGGASIFGDAFVDFLGICVSICER